MKSRFEEWAAARAQLSFCAPVFEEKRAARPVAPVSSNFAHPHAGNIVSKRASKHPSPYLASQYAVFGAKNGEKTFNSRDFSGVRISGLLERLENIA